MLTMRYRLNKRARQVAPRATRSRRSAVFTVYVPDSLHHVVETRLGIIAELTDKFVVMPTECSVPLHVLIKEAMETAIA